MPLPPHVLVAALVTAALTHPAAARLLAVRLGCWIKQFFGALFCMRWRSAIAWVCVAKCAAQMYAGLFSRSIIERWDSDYVGQNLTLRVRRRERFQV